MSTGEVGYFFAKVVRGNIGARRRKLNLANKYKTTLLAFIELRLSCGKFSSLPSCRKSEPSLSVEFDPTKYSKREAFTEYKNIFTSQGEFQFVYFESYKDLF